MIEDPNGEIDRLHPDARKAVLKLVRKMKGTTFRVRSGRRSCKKQRELYGIGRTYNLSSKPVTYADGCKSWHVMARAVDLDILEPATGKPVNSCSPYEAAGIVWEQMGGKWGGRWTKFGPCGDQGHYEWHPGLEMDDACPDPRKCEEVEVVIDAQIDQATKLRKGKLVLAGVGAGVVALLAVGLWYATQR